MAHIGLILASRSPRRAKLLREAGYLFEQVDPPFEDDPHPGQGSAQQVAMDLAAAKAMSIDANRYPQQVILAADTLVVNPDGSLAGTPTTAQQAKAMVQSFVGRCHEVVSAVALRWPDGRELTLFADAARVHVDQISDDQIDQYIATGQWQGKAGGYNLFDRQAAGWSITVDGDPTTVVGLPMVMLVKQVARDIKPQINIHE
jgi:septum formation protein